MIITNTNFSVNFSPLSDLKKRFINHSNLSEQFNEANILPIPDDAPDEVPRIICQTKNGHSNLMITKSSLSLSTKYDNEFLNNWSLCKEYLENKIELILKLLINLECNFLFSGLVTQIIYEPESNDATNELLSKFSKVKTNGNCYDFSQRLAFIQEEKYFVNLEINNIRLYNGTSPMTPGFLKNETDNKICIVVDVNDRYDFNYNQKFSSNKQNISKILNLTNNCISNIECFVKNAEVTL